MTTKKDIDILIECVEEAKKKRDSIAVQIVEWRLLGHEMTAKQIREYEAAKLGVESTLRDLENCVEIAAHAEMEETNAETN